MSYMHRTFDPKYAHYPPDGSGRDTYVIKNNGGLCIESEKPQYVTSMFFTRRQSTSPRPLKDATALKYISDGSGRDNYILIDSGGLQTPSVYGRKNLFANQLRKYEKIPWKANKSVKDLNDYQNWMSPDHRSSVRDSYNLQKQQSLRLATPKFLPRKCSVEEISKSQGKAIQEFGKAQESTYSNNLQNQSTQSSLKKLWKRNNSQQSLFEVQSQIPNRMMDCESEYNIMSKHTEPKNTKAISRQEQQPAKQYSETFTKNELKTILSNLMNEPSSLQKSKQASARNQLASQAQQANQALRSKETMNASRFQQKFLARINGGDQLRNTQTLNSQKANLQDL